MSTIADKLQDLVTAKEDMKTALVEKGVTPTGGLSTYADCIRGISGGGLQNLKFAYSTDLVVFPNIYTGHYTDMSHMFEYCSSLTTIPLLECGQVSDIRHLCNWCSALTTVGGFKDLGKQPNLPMFTYGNYYAPFGVCVSLTRESCLNIFNNLFDRESAGYDIPILEFPKSVLARLTDEDISIAVRKGWLICESFTN